MKIRTVLCLLVALFFVSESVVRGQISEEMPKVPDADPSTYDGPKCDKMMRRCDYLKQQVCTGKVKACWSAPVCSQVPGADAYSSFECGVTSSITNAVSCDERQNQCTTVFCKDLQVLKNQCKDADDATTQQKMRSSKCVCGTGFPNKASKLSSSSTFWNLVVVCVTVLMVAAGFQNIHL